MASKKSPKKRLKRAIPYIFILGIVLILLTTGFLIGRLTVKSDSSEDVSNTSSTIL